jgi:Ca2+-binding EF-hand superfamily protein
MAFSCAEQPAHVNRSAGIRNGDFGGINAARIDGAPCGWRSGDMKPTLPLLLILALCGCQTLGISSRQQAPRETDPDFHPTVELLSRYDANHDGTITRAEMEAGLKADFAAADTNHDGRLDPDETRAVNEKRWSEGLSTTSTLVDWNQDGFVDFSEFAGTARSLFAQIDRDGDGVLSPKELKTYAGHNKPEGQGDDQDETRGHPHPGGGD